jgi:outer membrane protein
MRVLIICCFISLSVVFVRAQQIWTLQACIDRAKTANLTVRQKQVAVEQAAIGVKTAQSQRLPILSANLSPSYNMGLSPTAAGTYEQFNASISNLSASLSQPVFHGFNIANSIKSSKLELKAVIAESEQACQDIAVNVIAGYLQVLLDKELVHAAQEQVVLSGKQAERTHKLVKVGKLSPTGLYEGNAQVAKDSSSLIKGESDLRLALLDLAQLLQLENAVTFDIATSEPDTLLSFKSMPLTGVDSLYRLALQRRFAVQAAQYRIEKGNADIAVVRSGYLPTLDLTAGYYNGYYYYYNMAQGYSNTSFSNQFRQNRQEVVALSLQIPIFNRFDVKHKVQSSKLSLQQQQLILENEKQQLYKTIQQVYYRSVSAQTKYYSLQKEVEALQITYRNALEKFEVGKATGFEVNEKQAALSKAISDRIEAKYDYLFSCKTLNFYINNSI